MGGDGGELISATRAYGCPTRAELQQATTASRHREFGCCLRVLCYRNRTLPAFGRPIVPVQEVGSASRVLLCSALRHAVVSRDIVDDCRETSWTISEPEGLVEPARIEPEVADQLSARGENPDVAVGHEDQDPAALVRSPTATWYSVER